MMALLTTAGFKLIGCDVLFFRLRSSNSSTCCQRCRRTPSCRRRCRRRRQTHRRRRRRCIESRLTFCRRRRRRRRQSASSTIRRWKKGSGKSLILQCGCLKASVTALPGTTSDSIHLLTTGVVLKCSLKF